MKTAEGLQTKPTCLPGCSFLVLLHIVKDLRRGQAFGTDKLSQVAGGAATLASDDDFSSQNGSCQTNNACSSSQFYDALPIDQTWSCKAYMLGAESVDSSNMVESRTCQQYLCKSDGEVQAQHPRPLLQPRSPSLYVHK